MILGEKTDKKLVVLAAALLGILEDGIAQDLTCTRDDDVNLVSARDALKSIVDTNDDNSLLGGFSDRLDVEIEELLGELKISFDDCGVTFPDLGWGTGKVVAFALRFMIANVTDVAGYLSSAVE